MEFSKRNTRGDTQIDRFSRADAFATAYPNPKFSVDQRGGGIAIAPAKIAGIIEKSG